MASEFNFKLLRRGAIYRIKYSAWKTSPMPISFILYPGTMKVHALVLNAPTMSAAEQMMFARFIKKMKMIPGVENYSGRVLYRILRMYYPSIIKKAYRTYFTSLIASHSIVSYGIVPEKLFTDLEFKIADKALFKQASKTALMKIVTTFTATEIKDSKLGMSQTLPFAKPAVVPAVIPAVTPNAQTNKQPATTQSNTPAIPGIAQTPGAPAIKTVETPTNENNTQNQNTNIKQPPNNPGGLEGYE